jgi:hypothetical protein
MFNSTDVFRGSDLIKLKSHLHEAEALSVRCPEEAMARTLLRRFTEWIAEARAIVEQAQAFLSTISANSSGGFATDETSDSADSRTDLEIVSQMLIDAESFPVKLSHHQELEALYMTALTQHFSLEEFLDKVDMSRNRRPGK